MKMKGDWDSGTSYSVGDVVRYDHVMYILQKDCGVGITPKDTLYWGRIELQEVLSMLADLLNEISDVSGDIPELAANLTTDTAGKALDATQGKALKELIPTNISNEAITLSTETGDYLITVDDSGDTPELAVTLISDEEDDT